MNEDNTTKQLTNTQQLVLPESYDFSQDDNPLDLVQKQIRNLSELPEEFTKNHKFTVEAKGRGLFIDHVNGTTKVEASSIVVVIERY